MAPKRRKVLEEVFDFSQWALQDISKAPRLSVSASDPPPMCWLGVQSLASIATGRDGGVIVCNAAKRDLHFELGYVDGYRKKTHIMMPLDAPRAVANLFSNELAKKVLRAPSFLTRLEDAGGGNLTLGLITARILAELDVYTPEEFEAMKTFCTTCGFAGDGKLPLRVSHVNGELVMALIDAVKLAKKCTYAAAQRICHRLLLDYWNFDMEASGRSEQTNLSSQIFHSIRLQEGSNGGQATICVGAPCLAEVLILIPGCELSTQLRRDMVKSFFGVGGNQVTFESLLSNPRIQAHLRGSDNPLAEFLEDGEHKILMRKLPRLLLQRDEELKEHAEHWQQIVLAREDAGQLVLKERDEHWQQIVLARDKQWREASRTRDETWSQAIQMLLQKRDQEAEVVTAKRDAAHLQAMEQIKTSVLQELGLKFGNLILQLGVYVSGVVIAAVKEGFALKKAVTKRKTISSLEMPEEQRASSLEAGPLALGLSTMALEVFPTLSFYAWRKIRGSFGHHAKQERLQRFNLGESHAFYIEKPLLWAYSGVTVEGGGARYVYTQAHRDLLLAVFRKQLQTSSKQRKDGAPRPTESLEERAHRLDASLTNAERLMQWPLHVAEIEPQWNEM